MEKFEADLLILLKAEAAAEPASQQSTAAEEREVLQEVPAEGLAGFLEQLRHQGTQAARPRPGWNMTVVANEEA